MKTKTAQETLYEIFNPSAQDCTTPKEDLQLAITLNPDLDKILLAMEEYKNQFSQLPASVTDEIQEAIEGYESTALSTHDFAEFSYKYLRSLLNHPPVMGEGEKAKEEIRRMFIDFCQSQEAYKIHTSEIELEKGIDDYLKSINPHQANT